METKFNKTVQKHRRRLLPNNWQEKLPLRPLLFGLGMLAVILVAILVNQPADSYLNNAEIDVLRNSEVIFSSADGCENQTVTRHTVTWQMSEGNIDIAIMSLEKLSGKSYIATETPFYRDPCVIMGYAIPAREDLGEKRIAVLHDTAACDVLSKYQQDEENALIIVTYAAYYDMLVALRAGSVDAVCMPRSVALTHREKAMVLSNYALGTVDYHVIGTSEEKDLISLIDSQLIEWANDGTLRRWYEAYDLLYDLA